MYTRREFGQLMTGSLALPLTGRLAETKVGGVRLGVQTYSFRSLPRGEDKDSVSVIIAAVKECGLSECELYAQQIEPTQGSRGGDCGAPEPRPVSQDTLRAWRLETPIDHFRSVGRQFDAAGLSIYAYNYSFNANMNDQEIDRGFEMTRALGAKIITASTNLTVAQRVVPFAEKHQMVVAMHGHSNRTNPNEFCTPESFAAAMKMSKYFKVNLDIGHFTAADFDAVAYISEHHASITNLHLKDRRKHQGDNVPWGEGDTPLRDVLLTLKKERWPIPAYIEYEYCGPASPTEEVKKCFQFVKQALA